MYLCRTQINPSSFNKIHQIKQDMRGISEDNCDCPRLGELNTVIAIKSSNIYYPPHRGTLSMKNILTQGRETYETTEGKYSVDKDHYLILNDNQEYSSFISERKEVESFSVFFSLDFVEDVYRNLKLPDNKILDEPENLYKYPAFQEQLYRKDKTINLIISELNSAINSGNVPENYIVEEIFYRLMENLFFQNEQIKKNIEKIPAMKQSTRIEIFKRLNLAKEYIHSHIDEPVNINEIARNSCLSPYHFLRLFKQVYHETPHQYIIKKRMEESKKMLLSGNLSITDISMELGFSSNSHFSNLFQKQFGLSPKEFRKSKVFSNKG